MKKYAIYGKGGIGKSTITSALSAALASMGYSVMQIGCDPKADSTTSLLGGKEQISVMEYLSTHEESPGLKEIVQKGYGGVYCVEAGGPTPGIGCAGRGIVTTFNMLEELEAFETYKPDIVLYDVLGDVVCGGFSAPIRDGYADEVIIVTSGEKMALFAAKNICKAVKNFEDRGYATVKGMIFNQKNIEDEEKYIQQFSEEYQIQVLGTVPRDRLVQYYENKNMTVIEGDIESDISKSILKIAEQLVEK